MDLAIPESYWRANAEWIMETARRTLLEQPERFYDRDLLDDPVTGHQMARCICLDCHAEEMDCFPSGDKVRPIALNRWLATMTLKHLSADEYRNWEQEELAYLVPVVELGLVTTEDEFIGYQRLARESAEEQRAAAQDQA